MFAFAFRATSRALCFSFVPRVFFLSLFSFFFFYFCTLEAAPPNLFAPPSLLLLLLLSPLFIVSRGERKKSGVKKKTPHLSYFPSFFRSLDLPNIFARVREGGFLLAVTRLDPHASRSGWAGGRAGGRLRDQQIYLRFPDRSIIFLTKRAIKQHPCIFFRGGGGWTNRTIGLNGADKGGLEWGPRGGAPPPGPSTTAMHNIEYISPIEYTPHLWSCMI